MGKKVIASFEYFQVLEEVQLRKRKTRDYTIRSKRGDILGRVEFHSAWRQHVLRPAPDTIWSAGCLTDIKTFLAGLKSEPSRYISDKDTP